MLSISEAEARAASLVEAARKAGPDAADALYIGDASTGVEVRLGALEDVQRSEGEEIGLRVFFGRRSATVSSSDLSRDALAALVERVVAMAREAPEDPYAGLAPFDRLARDERAIKRLNPTKLPSGTMPVIFDPRVGCGLLGHLIGAIAGSSITRRTSFLLDKRGELIFPPGIVIRDDPHRPRGLRSKPFDGEG